MILPEYFDRLREASPVCLYASGIDGARVFWPWRMNKAGAEADTRHVESCEHYVIDSNFNDDSVTNADVLDEAHELGADVAVLADVYHDADATVDALLEGLELADDHEFDGGLLLPLQPSHVMCYRELEASAPDGVWWGVGGVKDAPVAEKIAATQALRAEAGPDVHIHGFGFGVTDELARHIRSTPEILDSVDNSTSIQDAMNHPVAGSTEMMSVVAARAQAKRIESLRMMTRFAEEKEQTVQSGMEAFGAVADGGKHER